MKFIISAIFAFILFFSGSYAANAQIQLRTCKIGNVIYTEDARGTKCIPPLTPEGLKLLIAAMKSTAPPVRSAEFQKTESFCSIYRERNDVPNQLKYCGALSEMGSMSATDIMCQLHYDLNNQSEETYSYCLKSSNADRITGHLRMFLIHSKKQDAVTAVSYLYKGVERSFFKNINPTKQDVIFGSPSGEVSKFMTETYLTFAGGNLFGASLASLGFPDIQIEPSMSLNGEENRVVNDWIGVVDMSPLRSISNSSKVSFTIFTVPVGETLDYNGGRPRWVKDLAKPILCYLSDSEGNVLDDEVSKAACGYLVFNGKFVAAVDVNGDFAPSFISGNAEIQRGRVLLVN